MDIGRPWTNIYTRELPVDWELPGVSTVKIFINLILKAVNAYFISLTLAIIVSISTLLSRPSLELGLKIRYSFDGVHATASACHGVHIFGFTGP
jgi:hypothetical protein